MNNVVRVKVSNKRALLSHPSTCSSYLTCRQQAARVRALPEYSQTSPQHSNASDDHLLTVAGDSQIVSPDSTVTCSTSGRKSSTSYFMWPRSSRKILDRPPFLHDYPQPEGELCNINSFLGPNEVYQGKLHVPLEYYNQFLKQYLNAFSQGYLLFLTENYHNQPFRYFAELDFDWSVDLEEVIKVTNQVIQIVATTVQDYYRCTQVPSYLVTMRTPYKVHLNFPEVITTEPLAHQCREKIVARCKIEIGELPGVDWERIIDFPHGSLRMLGSKKTKHLNKDPEWVKDKAYYPVKWSEEEQQWKTHGIYFKLLQQLSIFPTSQQLQDFETSALFRDMAYLDIETYRAKIEKRKQLKAKTVEGEGQAVCPAPGYNRKDPIKVRFTEQSDGYITLQFILRPWARKERAMLAQELMASGDTSNQELPYSIENRIG